MFTLEFIKIFDKNLKMKLSTAVSLLAATTTADERKVPPRHPLQRLDRLVEFSAEILDEWFSFVKSKDSWKAKFHANGKRMEKNFKRGEQRCGHYDQHQLPHGGPEEDRKRRSDDFVDRYDRDDPSVGIKQITTGFRKWAQRYIAACSGQRQYQYQVNRMNKWNSLLQAHLTGSAPDLPRVSNLKEAISCEWSNQVKGVGSQNFYPTCADGEIEIISAKYGR